MRVGDFYETYGEDAVTTSKVLGIVQTRKSNGDQGYIELAGFPHHSLPSYMPKLVRAGYKVAVCDQLEDPKLAKKLVKRGVTEIVTPGVVYSDQVLTQKENNYIAALCFSKDRGGIAFLDVSTGEFKVAEGDLDYLDLLIADFAPKELLVQTAGPEGFREGCKGEVHQPGLEYLHLHDGGLGLRLRVGLPQADQAFQDGLPEGVRGGEPETGRDRRRGPAVLPGIEPSGGHRIHTGPDIGPDKHHIPH